MSECKREQESSRSLRDIGAHYDRPRALHRLQLGISQTDCLCHSSLYSVKILSVKYILLMFIVFVIIHIKFKILELNTSIPDYFYMIC